MIWQRSSAAGGNIGLLSVMVVCSLFGLLRPRSVTDRAAGGLQILVAQGRMGSRVKDLLKGPGQQEARWMTLLLCSNWTGGEPNKILDPFRAALFANPAIFSFGDLITATDAMDRSSVALSTIEQARVDLNAFIQAKTDLFEKLEELYRSM